MAADKDTVIEPERTEVIPQRIKYPSVSIAQTLTGPVVGDLIRLRLVHANQLDTQNPRWAENDGIVLKNLPAGKNLLVIARLDIYEVPAA
jgi:hypothetical protein